MSPTRATSKYFVYPYGASKSALTLARELRGKRVKRENSRYTYKDSHTLINWGASEGPSYLRHALNVPEAVSLASNKLKCFERLLESDLGGNNIPSFTTDKDVAKSWVLEDGATIYVRSLLNSCKGRGISIHSDYRNIPDAPLYVREVNNDHEFRIHIFQGHCIHIAQKKAMSSERRAEENIILNPSIKNRGNGYVFAIQDINVPTEALEVAIEAVRTLGLDFGAIDLVCDPVPTILEVNTAPGLEGTTLAKYVEAIQNMG